MNTSTPESIANDLYFSIQSIFELANSYETVDNDKVKKNLLAGIQDLIEGLKAELTKFKNQSEIKLQAAMQYKFVYARVFSNSQTLEILVTVLYIILQGIEKKANYTLFTDKEYLLNVNKVIESNSYKLKNLF